MGFRKYTREIREYLKTRRNRRLSKKQTKHLQLEALEDRVVPTVAFIPQFGPISVQYGGGPVLNSVPIELLFNGPYWTDPTIDTNGMTRGANRTTQVENAVRGVISSPYLSGAATPSLPGVLPGTPTLDTVAIDPNSLATDFGYFAVGLLTPITPGPGTLSANVNLAVDNGLLPEPDSRGSHHPLYLVITSPGIQAKPSPFSDNRPAGFHAWFPELDGIRATVTPPFIEPNYDTLFTAWVKTNTTADGSLDMDSFTKVLSHEIVESVTDPGGGWFLPDGLDGIAKVIAPLIGVPLPGLTGSGGQLGGTGFNELADGEPDQFGYTYRLPSSAGPANGTIAQAFWSDTNHAFIVSDGNSQNFNLNPIFNRDSAGNFILNSNGNPQFTGTYDLNIQGDQISGSPNDNIIITQTTNSDGSHGVEAILNGQIVTFDRDRIHSISVNTGSGDDHVTVDALPSGVSLTINLGNGTDTVEIGHIQQNLDPIQGTVSVNGGGGTDTLEINDASNTFGHTYALTADTFQRNPWDSPIPFTGMSAVMLFGSNASDDYEIQNTPSNAATSIFMNASPTNTVNVQSTDGPLDIFSSFLATSADTDIINLGGGYLDPLNFLVTVHGQPTSTQVNLFDQNAYLNGIYDISNQAITRSFAVDNNHPFGGPTPFGGLHYSGLRLLTLNSEAAGNTVNIASTAAGTSTVINTDSPTEGVNIGEGDLTNIAGPVTVNGNSMDTEVSVDDSNNQATTSYEVDATQLSRAGSTILNYSGLKELALHGTGAPGMANGDVIDIEGTGASDLTSIYAAADNTITMGALSHNLDAVGHVSILAGGGSATLTVDDQGRPNSIVPPGSTTYSFYPGDLNNLPNLTRQASYLTFNGGIPSQTTATANIDYANVAMTLNAGPRRNRINVFGTGGNTLINAGPAGDTIDVVGPSLTASGLTAPLVGQLNVNANRGTLILDDSVTQDVPVDRFPDPGTSSDGVTFSRVFYTVNAGEVDRRTNATETTVTMPDPGTGTGTRPTTTTHHQSYNAAILYSNASSLDINGAPVAAGNAFNVLSTPLGTNVVLNVGSATSTVDLGAGNLDNLQGAVTVNGLGQTAVNLNDQSTPTSRDYTVTNTTFSRPNFGGLTYAGVGALTVNSEALSHTTNVNSTIAATPVRINEGVGVDTINVGNGNLDSLAGSVDVHGHSATTVNLNDQSAPVSNNYTLTATAFTRPNFGGMTYSSIGNLVVNEPFGPYGNWSVQQRISVQGTAAGVNTTINAANGWHVISVGDNTHSLSNMHGAITVNGGNSYHDMLTLWDLGSTGSHGRTYSLYSDHATATSDGIAAPATMSWTGLLGEIALYGTNHSDEFDVNSLPNGTSMVVNGDNGTNTVRSLLPGIHTWNIYGGTSNAATVTLDGQVSFGQTWNLVGGPSNDVYVFVPQYGINAVIGGTIDGGGGTNTLDYSHWLSADNMTGVNVHLADTGFGTATSTGGVANIQNLIGSRFNDVLIGNNQDNVFQSPRGRDVMMGMGGNDTFRIWGAQDPGTVIDGGTGANTMWASDFPNTWNLTGQGSGTVLGTIPGYVSGFSFTNMQNLLGGLNNDTFVMANGTGVAGWINGNYGQNTLDYSAYTTPVNVNLSAYGSYGSAMNAPQGVMNIQTVIGSRTAVDTLTGSNVYASVLVGGANNDVLTAGTQRAILIGGQGADSLTGGPADDILISGTTSYDTNATALQAIVAEWNSGHSYADRIDLIRGVTNNPLYSSRLNGNYFFNASTVFGDASSDTLMGGAGMDWFWATLGQDRTDRNGSEVLN